MAAGSNYPLSLIVKAVDKVSGPLHAITQKLQMLTGGPAFKSMSRLGHDFSELKEALGLPKLAAGFGGLRGAVGNVVGETLNLGGKLLGLASIAGVALFAVVRGAVDAGDKLAEMAQRTGLGVDTFASLQHAAAQADVEQDAFNSSMDKFNKNLGDMKANGGTLLAFLQKVSPTLADQVKHAKGAEAALSLMTDAFVRLEDPGKRAALAGAAFGKSNVQMGEFLHQGSAAIQAQQREFLRLAGSQEKFAQSAGNLDNILRDAETAFMGVRAAVAGALFPAIGQLAKAVTDFVVKNRDGIAAWASDTAKALQKWIDGGGIERLVAGLRGFADTLGRVIDFVGGFKGVLVVAAAVLAGPLVGALLGVIPAVYALGAALLTTPVGWVLLAVAAIAASVWLIYKNWDGIVEFFTGLNEAVGNVFKGLGKIATGIATMNLGLIFDGWKQSLEGFKLTLAGVLALMPAGGFVLGKLAEGGFFDGVGAPAAGAEAARPGAGGLLQSTEAKVSVDFSNVPRGVNVSLDRSSSADVDLSVGRSMVTP